MSSISNNYSQPIESPEKNSSAATRTEKQERNFSLFAENMFAKLSDDRLNNHYTIANKKIIDLTRQVDRLQKRSKTPLVGKLLKKIKEKKLKNLHSELRDHHELKENIANVMRDRAKKIFIN
jgi:hypothetical protein